MNGVIEIDGSFGEGGGQVVRTALSLSIVTGKPVRLFRIRAGRTKPGLAHQHLTCIKAARQLSSARVKGDTLGSDTLEFVPEEIRPGDYSLDVKTAGSVSLVFQTLFLPLSLARDASRVTVRGGTHVKWSPSFEFLHDQWLFYLKQIGFGISLRLEKAGYYPQGGGILKARVQPAGQLRPLVLSAPGELQRVRGLIFISNLKKAIADHQLAQAKKNLLSRGISPEIEIRDYPSPGTGTGTHLRAAFENGSGSFTSLGERGVPAERVASISARSVCDYIDSGAAVDRFTADQLILPLSFTGGESFFTCEQVTPHLVTNARIVEMFMPVRVKVDGELGQPGQVHIISEQGAP